MSEQARLDADDRRYHDPWRRDQHHAWETCDHPTCALVQRYERALNEQGDLIAALNDKLAQVVEIAVRRTTDCIECDTFHEHDGCSDRNPTCARCLARIRESILAALDAR